MHTLEQTLIPISAVVICKNEEQNIARCIKSLQQVTNDIVVVDSGSIDNTIAIAESLGARCFYHAWEGYSNQKNYGNSLALHDYIISIDADEEISEGLAKSINVEMKNPDRDAYELNFLTSYQNKFVYYGSWNPDRHVRIFKKSKISWGEAGVHEELILKGAVVKRLKGYIHHYTAHSRQYYRTKLTRYAQEFAHNKQCKNQRSLALKKYISASFRFIKDYVFYRGFLDGKAGLDIALEEARYTYLKYKWSEESL
jgi:glycosyltransferase involved in cell wall biosynthesis